MTSCGSSGHPAVHLTGPFQTSGRQVVCDIEPGNVGCEMHASTAWKVPPKPKDCNDDWLGGVDLNQPRPAHFGCWSGAPGLGAQSIPTLRVGRVVINGNVRCTIRSDGVQCDDTSDGHGFVYTRSSYRFF